MAGNAFPGDAGIGDDDLPACRADFFRKLYTIRPNGTALTKLTHLAGGGSSTASAPAWSPDGMKIVYQGPYASIWIMNVNGSQPRKLTYLDKNATNPAWAPGR